MKEERIKETVKLQFEMIHLYHKIFAKMFHQIRNSAYNLNKNQNRAIMIIGASENIMPTTLGKCLDLQKGSLTSMIDALEKEGLVYRQGDPEDRRKTLISLTDKGKEYREWFTEEIEKKTSKILEELDEENIVMYQESLQAIFKILKSLDETCNR
jgi:DNA-binding MarR family transcriptional regulator